MITANIGSGYQHNCEWLPVATVMVATGVARSSSLLSFALMFASPDSSQTAVCTILSMMKSAWTPPRSLACQSIFWCWVQKIVDLPSLLSSMSSIIMLRKSSSGLYRSHSSNTRTWKLPYFLISFFDAPGRILDARHSSSRSGIRM